MHRLPEELHGALVRADGRTWSLPPPPAGAGVAFRIHGPDLGGSMIFVGLFPTAVPQGRPAAGTVLEAPGSYRLRLVPDGRYHLMAAALPRSKDPWKLLLPGNSLRVGRAHRPVVIRRGRADAVADMALRPTRSTDPPVLVALPALLLERLTAGRNDP